MFDHFYVKSQRSGGALKNDFSHIVPINYHACSITKIYLSFTLSTYQQKTEHLQQCIKDSWMLKPQEITVYMTLEKAGDFGLMVARLLMRKREWVVRG